MESKLQSNLSIAISILQNIKYTLNRFNKPMTLIVWTLQVNYKHSHSKDMIEYIKDKSSRYQCIYLHRVWGIKKELLISITESPWFNNLRILNQESKRRDLSRVIESEQQTLHLKSQSEIIQTGERFTLESRVKLTTISI